MPPKKAVHKHLSQKEAARQLDMWAGAHSVRELETLIVDNETLSISTVVSSDALMKVIWEIISNAIDQFIMGCEEENRAPVRIIKIDFKDGRT
jgi:DNA gyrase/topoisomerase IV subunit B